MPLAVADGMVLESVLARTHLALDNCIRHVDVTSGDNAMQCDPSSLAADKLMSR